MPRRKPIHQKVLSMQKKNEAARLAMHVMKVRLCVEMKMSMAEMSQHTGLSQKSIDRVFEKNNDLAQLHTFSLLDRTEVDDRYINRNIKKRWF